MSIIALARCRYGASKGHESDKETWEREMARFPTAVRHTAANLAAHSWDVTLVDGRLLVSCAWYAPHQQVWYDEAGERTPLTEEEMDTFYPQVSKENQRWPRASQQSGKWRGYTITLEPTA